MSTSDSNRDTAEGNAVEENAVEDIADEVVDTAEALPESSAATALEAISTEALEAELLGGTRRYTRREVARLAGTDFERLRALWVALGFAEVDDAAVVFTDSDVEIVRVWQRLVDAGVIEQDTEVSIARALGQTFSGLAEWEMREVTRRFRALTGDPEDANRIAAALLPIGEYLHNYVWRRHLAAVAGRALSAPAETLDVRELVVGFADIVGYTSATRHVDAGELADLLESFFSDAATIVTERRGRVVKTVGDEVLYVADSPTDAAEIALAFADPSRKPRGLPVLRSGSAFGEVLSRHGDVYGSTVNLAARLTSMARPGTALVDRELAAALRDEPGFRLRSRRPVNVRGYSHVRSWVLRRDAG